VTFNKADRSNQHSTAPQSTTSPPEPLLVNLPHFAQALTIAFALVVLELGYELHQLVVAFNSAR
jgi:hypothetical protein